MALRPEDVKNWEVNDELVQDKLEAIGHEKNGRLLTDTYHTLKGKLNRYPPDPKAFSDPIHRDQDGYYWVRSENKAVTVRAKFYPSHDVCIIDKLYLAHETPKDLSPEKGEV